MSTVRLAGLPALAAAAGLALAACSSASLSDEAYRYCTTQATPAELDAAAEALNISPDADRRFETNPNRGDPTYHRVCQYAWDAHSRNLGAPGVDPNGPGAANPTAPLDPQRSEGATFAAPSPVSPASS